MSKPSFRRRARPVADLRGRRSPPARRAVRLCLALFLLLGLAAPGAAASRPEAVQTAWRLLDYVAVDYPGAVQKGRVVSNPEYSEMREFSTTVEAQLRSLEAKPEKSSLIGKARSLEQAINSKASPDSAVPVE